MSKPGLENFTIDQLINEIFARSEAIAIAYIPTTENEDVMICAKVTGHVDLTSQLILALNEKARQAKRTR